MKPETGLSIHHKMLGFGFLFLISYIVARYYIVLVLLPEGLLTQSTVYLRDSLLQVAFIISGAAIILSSIGFKKDEENIVFLIFIPATLAYLAGLYLDSVESQIGLYLIYNAGVILIALTGFMILGFLGFRSSITRSFEPDRLAKFVLAIMLTINVVVSLWEFGIASSGRIVAPEIEVFKTHLLNFSIWIVLSTYIMNIVKVNAKLFRWITTSLVVAAIIWTLSFAGYVFGFEFQILAGGMDIVLGSAFLIILLAVIRSLIQNREFTQNSILGAIGVFWLIIAGAIGLYLVLGYSSQGLDVPAGWRVFHLINANWSLTIGLSALAITQIKINVQLAWAIVILAIAGMIRAVITYLINVSDPVAANTLLNIGEPFLLIGFIIILYTSISNKT